MLFFKILQGSPRETDDGLCRRLKFLTWRTAETASSSMVTSTNNHRWAGGRAEPSLVALIKYARLAGKKSGRGMVPPVMTQNTSASSLLAVTVILSLFLLGQPGDRQGLFQHLRHPHRPMSFQKFHRALARRHQSEALCLNIDIAFHAEVVWLKYFIYRYKPARCDAWPQPYRRRWTGAC